MSAVDEVRHGMTIPEFVDQFEAGRLSLAESGRFSVAELPPPHEVIADPTSESYGDWVMNLWRSITGRTAYRPEVDEAFDVPIDQFLRGPYPYSSGSAIEVGNYLGAIAWMLRVVEPRPEHRVVEYGSGWGLLALNLAMLRCD